MKLNVLLGKTDHLSGVWKNQLLDFLKFFKDNQSAFKGEKKTFEAKPGVIDMPKERSNKKVVTTVAEKLVWLEENCKEYFDALFSQEKTNATGIPKGKVVVDGKLFGEFTSLELLRLKSTLENGTFKDMYAALPVRNDDELWTKSSNEMYDKRDIYETGMITGMHKTITKEQYIIQDPNIRQGMESAYVAQVASRDTTVELGEYTYQRFSGEFSHLQRAEILKRISKLLTAVIVALKECNEVEAAPSEMTSEKLFDYLHRDKINERN